MSHGRDFPAHFDLAEHGTSESMWHTFSEKQSKMFDFGAKSVTKSQKALGVRKNLCRKFLIMGVFKADETGPKWSDFDV